MQLKDLNRILSRNNIKLDGILLITCFTSFIAVLSFLSYEIFLSGNTSKKNAGNKQNKIRSYLQSLDDFLIKNIENVNDAKECLIMVSDLLTHLLEKKPEHFKNSDHSESQGQEEKLEKVCAITTKLIAAFKKLSAGSNEEKKFIEGITQQINEIEKQRLLKFNHTHAVAWIKILYRVTENQKEELNQKEEFFKPTQLSRFLIALTKAFSLPFDTEIAKGEGDQKSVTIGDILLGKGCANPDSLKDLLLHQFKQISHEQPMKFTVHSVDSKTLLKFNTILFEACDQYIFKLKTITQDKEMNVTVMRKGG